MKHVSPLPRHVCRPQAESSAAFAKQNGTPAPDERCCTSSPVKKKSNLRLKQNAKRKLYLPHLPGKHVPPKKSEQSNKNPISTFPPSKKGLRHVLKKYLKDPLEKKERSFYERLLIFLGPILG